MEFNGIVQGETVVKSYQLFVKESLGTGPPIPLSPRHNVVIFSFSMFRRVRNCLELTTQLSGFTSSRDQACNHAFVSCPKASCFSIFSLSSNLPLYSTVYRVFFLAVVFDTL